MKYPTKNSSYARIVFDGPRRAGAVLDLDAHRAEFEHPYDPIIDAKPKTPAQTAAFDQDCDTTCIAIRVKNIGDSQQRYLINRDELSHTAVATSMAEMGLASRKRPRGRASDTRLPETTPISSA